jgi:hypothetical protein
MSDLICGNCGGEIIMREVSGLWYFDCYEQNGCPVSSVIINKVLCPTEAEAIAAFKKATRVSDVNIDELEKAYARGLFEAKQGIDWIYETLDLLEQKNPLVVVQAKLPRKGHIGHYLLKYDEKLKVYIDTYSGLWDEKYISDIVECWAVLDLPEKR